MTLDIAETFTVGDAKVAIEQSGQTKPPLAVSQMRIFKASLELHDHETLIACCRKPPEELNQLSLVLRSTRKRTQQSIRFCLPTQNVPLTSAVVIHCTPDLAIAATGIIDVRSIADQPVKGTQRSRNGVIEFQPAEPLCPKMKYSVYVDMTGRGMFVDAALQFETEELLPVRIIARDACSGRSKLIVVERSCGSLLCMLLQAIASRFSLAKEAITNLTKASGDSDTVIAINSDDAVIALHAEDMVLFEILPPACWEQGIWSVKAKENRLQMPHCASRSEYLQRNWVNDEAGYYAVSGKMDAAEEEAALLEVVRVFSESSSGDGVITATQPTGKHSTSITSTTDEHSITSTTDQHSITSD
jgi:hypothetical protein